MSFFNTILKKLGMGHDEPAAPPPAPANTPQVAASQPPIQAGPSTPDPAPTKAISQVDVVAKLDGLASASKEKLNWKTSIVDLMKLLGMDSSLQARKDMASELGCPPEKMNDSAQLNMWLHNTVLQKLADNGGNIPKDLL